MGDAGFFRGTSSDQDGRFSDKEKKLLKQMKFEDTLEKKINMEKVNLDIIKPWITMRINEILGIEDDVVIEYIIGQLEAKNINPKVMQINITGFLNARRAREFMGELWMLLVEADMSEDGIPQSLVDKKLSEMKREAGRNGDSKPPAPVAQNDWANRYQTLSLGRFSGPTKEKEVRDDRMIIPERPSSRSPRRERDRDGRDGKGDRDRGERRETRDGTPPRRKEFDEREKRRQDDDVKRREDEGKRREEERLKRRAEEKERERRRENEIEKRREERSRRDDKRRRSRSRSRSPVRRRFTEGSAKKRRDGDSSESEEEVRHKKKKKHSRHSSDDDDEPKREKKSKKHKKEKKKKERKRSPTPSTASDTE